MKLKRAIVACVMALTAVGLFAGPASAGGCSGDGPIPTLYKKVTGEELIHCP